MTNLSNRKAALYVRVSTNHQIDKDSLPFQIEDLVNYCSYALGINRYMVFQDAGYSGKNTQRPAYQDMMKRVRNGEFTHIIVWKIDRISRNLLDFASMYEELKKYNVTFVSKNEQFDTSSAMGEAMLKIILIFAELERKLTAERVYAIMLSRAEKGLWNGANVPLGYEWSEEMEFPQIDDVEADTVNLIYEQYMKLKSSTDVAALLNTNNISTKRGGTWTSKTISDIIRNPFYKGTYRYNYREGARGTIKDEREWIVLPNNHEAIIDEEFWETVNYIMDENAKKNAAFFRKNINTHIFSSMLVCTHCNKGFNAHLDIARKDGFQPSIYRCQNKLQKLPCTSKKIATDVKIAPFILQLISNIIAYQNEEDFNAKCLKSKVFKDVENIEILNPVYEIENEEYILNGLEDNVSYEFMIKEKDKYTRALERLENLYLYSDDAMSEKDYLIKKREIEEKIKELKIPEKHQKEDNFIEEASYFILTNEMLNKRDINYKKLVTTMDKDLLKEFLNLVIDKIYINNNKVDSVRFANGMVYSFKYKS